MVVEGTTEGSFGTDQDTLDWWKWGQQERDVSIYVRRGNRLAYHTCPAREAVGAWWWRPLRLGSTAATAATPLLEWVGAMGHLWGRLNGGYLGPGEGALALATVVHL